MHKLLANFNLIKGAGIPFNRDQKKPWEALGGPGGLGWPGGPAGTLWQALGDEGARSERHVSAWPYHECSQSRSTSETD